jgi:AraC-like DNA-binding protein
MLSSICLYGNSNNIVQIKNWEILYDQNNSIEIIDKSPGWKNIDIPGMFRLPYESIGEFQYIWLKGEFEVKNDSVIDCRLNIENVYGSIAVYINKQPAGYLPPQECYSIHNPVDLHIPGEILIQGKNKIYIHLGIYDKYPGGISGKIFIQDAENNNKTASLNRFIYYDVPFGSVMFLIILAIFNISLFIWDRKERANLYAALLCLFYAIQLYLLFIPFWGPGIKFRMNSFYLLMWTAPIIFIYLIQALYNEFLNVISKFFSITVLILFLFSLSDILLNFHLPFKGGFHIAITFVTMLINIYTLYRLNNIKPDPLLFYFFTIACILIPYIIWAIDLINYYFGNQEPPRYSILFSPIFMIILMTLVIRKISRKHMRMKRLYSQLKDSLNDNILIKDSKPQITSINQRKLDSIISFINENYRDDISREGLASSVDLSPDHLSRIFNTYTGKRINNLINELRVKDSARRLINSDDKIIDIAFSVGFESVTTFNRVFLEIMGKTPSKYREEKH